MGYHLALLLPPYLIACILFFTTYSSIPPLKSIYFDLQGDRDLMCPFLGLKRIVSELEWPGRDVFRKELQKPEMAYKSLIFESPPQYGSYVQAEKLMYARIFGAGHMPNEGRGLEVRDMIYRWIGGDFTK